MYGGDVSGSVKAAVFNLFKVNELVKNFLSFVRT